VSSLLVTDLSKSFGRKQALDNVSLSVNEGEFVVLLGPTAAGKTTTLRCVAGLERLDGGKIMLGGVNITRLSPAERDVALVFQSYALYPRKTAYENMAFPLRARRMATKAIDQRVKEIAELLRITELLNRRPAQMSGGQQQRVALGRAMVRQPQLFLMDEPLTNLDFKLRVEMRTELKRLQSELDATFFYVTNDQVEAMSMADRIIVLNEGVVQQIDTPEGIYDHPANLFVAQFVGSPRMNTLPCRYDAATRTIHGLDGSWWMTPTIAHAKALDLAPDPHALIFGCRPEDISFVLPGDGDAEGVVYVLEPLGDRTFVDVHVGEYEVRIRAEPTVDLAKDDIASFQFDSSRSHVFDAVTGATLY
jgi:multiple sugar transport system ATP-binding protein